MTPTVFFLHGRDSDPQSTKIQTLATVAKRNGWRVIAPDFSVTKDPDERVRMFLEVEHQTGAQLVIVGSSMGGYVATVASGTFKPDALLLLAPALNIEGYRELNPVPVAGETTIVHGWNDDLIGPVSVFRFAEKHQASLHMVTDGHTLHQSLPFIEQVFSDILKRCHPTSRHARLTAVL